MARANVSARVVISKDGPYLVTGSPPLSRQTIITDSDGGSERWQEGETFAVQKNYALCRCGHSNNKPYCDGTHTKIGFDGTETASREPYVAQAKVIDGPTMVLSDAESLCAFGRFCDTHGGVWKAQTDEPTIRATVLRQAENCPAGRLVAWDKATGKPVEHDSPVSIGLVEDPEQQCSGPIWLRGGIAVISADGFEYEVRHRVTLCRCGQSRNKPSRRPANTPTARPGTSITRRTPSGADTPRKIMTISTQSPSRLRTLALSSLRVQPMQRQNWSNTFIIMTPS
jgi:CDGSH-type Zn-finger protein